MVKVVLANQRQQPMYQNSCSVSLIGDDIAGIAAQAAMR